MRLGRRILDLVSVLAHGQTAGAAPSRRLEPASGAQGKARQIRRSLATAEARRKQLQDALTAAEQAGRDRETLLLRREMAELSRSTDQLRAALDVIEARLAAVPPLHGGQTARQPQAIEATEATEANSLAESPAQDQDVSAAPPADDLKARKRRLAGPA
jgi:seryl-tRNA synthetase